MEKLLTFRRWTRRGGGFTLVELLVVLVILGLLIGLAATTNIGYVGRAKTDVAKVQVQNFEQALDLFRLDVGRYPTQEEGLKALIARPGNAPKWKGPYLKGGQVPADPWGRPYLYEQPSKRGLAYDLYTLGADNARGGDGEQADIYNK